MLHPVTVPAQTVKSKTGGVQVVTVASIKGQDYAFVVDTGASVTTLDSNLVTKIGLPAAGAVKTTGEVGCKATAQPVTLADWSIGGEKLPSAVVLSATVDFAGKTFQGHEIAGVLGSEVYQAFGTLQVNFAGNSISLGAQAASGKPSFPVLVDAHAGTAELLASATLHGQTANMLVDSGASTTLVDTATATKAGLAKAGNPTKVNGLSCSTPAQPVTIDQLAVGSVQLPTVTGISVGPESSSSSEVVGLIGSDILSTYGTVTFDYNAKKVTLGG